MSCLLTACTNSDKPTLDRMKECLSSELANKAIVLTLEQQDGLKSQKDGVNYYEGYFNAEIKFIANYLNLYKAGEKYKIIKGTLSFMKTENGWNCQSFDMSSANLVKIKEVGDNTNHIDASENQSKVASTSEDNNQNSSILSIYNSDDGQEYTGTINGNDINLKIKWKSNKTLSGIYYIIDNPTNIISWNGTNFNDGEIQITEFNGSSKIGDGKLVKSIDGNTITWAGNIFREGGAADYIQISRPR
jgi:hypothetical protein